MKNNRKFWIDNAKGICIFCVVALHVSLYCFGIHPKDSMSLIYRIVDPFFLPCFFIISGYLSKKIFVSDNPAKFLKESKTYLILLPFFIVGFIYSFIISNGDIKTAINGLMFTNAKNGYWFLLSLFFCKLSYIISCISTQKIKGKVAHALIFSLCYLLIIKLLSCLNYIHPLLFGEILQRYSHFYLFGIIVGNSELLLRLLCHNFAYCAFFLTSVASLLYCFFVKHTDMVSINSFLFAPLFILSCKTLLNKNIKCLSKLGNITLDIYVFHFLFYIGIDEYLSQYSSVFCEMPFLFQIIIISLIAFANISCCYILSKLIRANRSLSKIIIGR